MSSQQLKDKIRNISKEKNTDFNTLLRLYMYDRFIERLAVSKLKDQVMNDKWQAIQYLLDGNGYKATEQQQVQMDARLEIDYGE